MIDQDTRPQSTPPVAPEADAYWGAFAIAAEVMGDRPVADAPSAASNAA